MFDGPITDLDGVRLDADARPGAEGLLTEEDYRVSLRREDGTPKSHDEIVAEAQAKRELVGDEASIDFTMPAPEPKSPLELASSFLGDHRVVELLEAGARPVITYTVLAEPSGECRVMATFHGAAREDGTAENTDELNFAHAILLDMLRRQIDRVYEPGEAARRMFAMATDPDPLADQSEAESLLRTRPPSDPETSEASE